ncbi:cell surface protein [Aquimarina agarivorans]|uniref:cell surface protein n=1 Tax=Aquimarina agarivorans TaxID=980584 RepID=UPI000248F8A1|nr:cell surface protein [Aquimarina agarivorans]
MKHLNDDIESPFILKISFNTYLKKYEALTTSTNKFLAEKAKRILDIQAHHPILRDGFSDVSLLDKYKDEIKFILQDAFSEILTSNEIKTASVPFYNYTFNPSERFKNILEVAGNDYELTIENIPENDQYIIACTVILNFCYGFDVNIKRPFFYKIPDANGIMRYYKILYNADFMEIILTEKAIPISQNDFDQLLDNFDNIALWKTKFPENSYLFKGFVISNIFDVTDDQSISNIKSKLIGKDKRKDGNFIAHFEEIFQSLLNIKDLKVGFANYNNENHTFEQVYGTKTTSFLLLNSDYKKCTTCLCNWSQKRLLEDNKFVTISDIDEMYLKTEGKIPQVKTLYKQQIKSAILAPIANDQGLFGVLELVSSTPKVLNSIIANKLIDVMPHIVAAVQHSTEEEANLIEAIIQKECTSIHPSVHWKFKKEAKRYIREQQKGNQVSFGKLVFKDVYPLYGQIDLKGSSEVRNWATREDLSIQLINGRTILNAAFELNPLPIYEQYLFQISSFLMDLKENFQVDSEQKITAFLKQKINIILYHIKNSRVLETDIESYFNSIDSNLQVYYHHRKNYDNTVTSVNKRMAALLDAKQVIAQKMYPHFFERHKTDGVDHNMYIGEAITEKNSFNLFYLYNLRLWQLQVMCEMENAFYKMQPKFTISMDVASMILVFSTPLTISFRTDEKQFDVDGTYNARYEVVKKRVDKAYIKGTKERITQKGKITIVYSQKEDEREYLKYIKFLQSKNYLGVDVEIIELDDLQGVTGLKAIRVNVLYMNSKSKKGYYTYDDLMKIIKE